MTWVFVVILSAVSLTQAAVEISKHQMPQALDVFRPVRAAALATARGDGAGVRAAASVVVSRGFPKEFEAALEKASIAKSFFQPRLQSILTGRLGFGNDKVVVARGGWLFYQPGVDYLAGPDITDPGYIALTSKKLIDKQGEHDPHPDARAAILAFNRECEAAGIHLVLLPIPDKAMLQPGQLTARMAIGQPVSPPNNRGYGRFVTELRAQGVDIFDPTPDAIEAADVRYLVQDTHWTPEFMDTVAAGLARHIDRWEGRTRPNGHGGFELRAAPASRVGDLVDTLRLPRDQRLFEPQSVTVQQVIASRTGRVWERDAAADVLLLGDSFTNIFSQPALGWGESGGFAEHLSYHLGRSIDVIAFNGAGASATREELARRALDRGDSAPTKVIVYQFAMRFLMGENWRVIPFKMAPSHSVPPAATTGGLVSVIARVTQTSNVPAPGTAPYKDCLTYVKLHIEHVESGGLPASDVIGAFWAMRDNTWLPAATYAVGDRLRLDMIPLEQADAKTQTLQRADDLNDFTSKVFFVTNEARQ
jgi:hypothetical protein